MDDKFKKLFELAQKDDDLHVYVSGTVRYQ
jgi:hypothetical protein